MLIQDIKPASVSTSAKVTGIVIVHKPARKTSGGVEIQTSIKVSNVVYPANKYNNQVIDRYFASGNVNDLKALTGGKRYGK